MQALGFEDLFSSGARQRPDSGDTPADDPYVGGGNTIGGGDNPATDQKIETFPHAARQLAQQPALGNYGGPP